MESKCMLRVVDDDIETKNCFFYKVASVFVSLFQDHMEAAMMLVA